MDRVWWYEGEGSKYLGSIPWSCNEQLRFGVEIPPHSRLSVVRRFGLPLWTGDLWIYPAWPICTDPGPVGVCQALLGILVMESSPQWSFPHEVSIAVIVLVVEKCSVCSESIMGYIPSDLWNEIWLGRDHLVNLFHGPGSGLRGFPDHPAWNFSFGPPWTLVGLTKQTGGTRG